MIEIARNNHPYFSSSHYRQTMAITKKRLQEMGYTSDEVKNICQSVRQEIAHRLASGMDIYIDGVYYSRKGSW
jgi:hypothetical protein